jgi:UMF1 family MFS transporter
MTGLNRNAVFGWGMYDWANSAFATTVMAGFFPIFFKQYWSHGTDATVSTARLGLANSLAGVLVAMAAPLLGAIADRSTSRKRFLLVFAALGVLMTSSLTFVAQGNWAMAAFLFVCATVGFSGSNIFYDSLITVVSTEERMDQVSALGFSMGYLGGGVLFAMNVWMTLRPETFGFADAAAAVRFSFLTVGIWWAVFSLPLAFLVKEPDGEKGVRGRGMVRAGMAQLAGTFREIRHLKTIALFLAAYWLYIDGVDTIVRMAVDYGISIGFEANDLIVALLVTQFVGFPAAIAFGFLGSKIGAKRGILIAIAVYLGLTLWAAFIRERYEFFVMAAVIGLVQGGVQALSRSFYARIIPPDKSAEYFGFYNMLGKFAAVIGPVLMGGAGLFVRSLGYSSDTATRASITTISILFIAGGMLLLFVDEEKGRREVEYLVNG